MKKLRHGELLRLLPKGMFCSILGFKGQKDIKTSKLAFLRLFLGTAHQPGMELMLTSLLG